MTVLCAIGWLLLALGLGSSLLEDPDKDDRAE